MAPDFIHIHFILFPAVMAILEPPVFFLILYPETLKLLGTPWPVTEMTTATRCRTAMSTCALQAGAVAHPTR